MLSNNFKIGVRTLVLEGIHSTMCVRTRAFSHRVQKVVMHPSPQVVHALLGKTGVSTSCTEL